MGEERGALRQERPAARSRYVAAALLNIARGRRIHGSSRTVAHIAYRALKAGSPTNYIFLNPIIAEAPNTVWVGKTAPRPYGAALLADFLLAKESQQYFAQKGRRMAHKEVAYLPNPPAHYRWITPNREKWGPRSNELIKMYRETFISR
jgi:hypothetical protein